jgi:hypothetical protein
VLVRETAETNLERVAADPVSADPAPVASLERSTWAVDDEAADARSSAQANRPGSAIAARSPRRPVLQTS